MTRTLLCLAVLLMASPAGADVVPLWFGVAVVDPQTEAHAFRFATSETAYVEHAVFGPNNPTFWTAESGPNVVALIADLTNGVNNPITWSTPYFSLIVDENWFDNVPRPLQGGSFYMQNGKIDLADYSITYIQMDAAFGVFNPWTTPIGVYRVTVFGHAPEPASGLLFVIGLCGMLLHRVRS